MDGARVDIPLGKPFAVLVRLAFTPEGVTRAELARLLWAHADSARARQSVRQALSQLRSILDPELLVGDDPVHLDRSRLSTDVAEVRAALAAGRVEEALALRGGRFLESFEVDSSRFERWAEELRSGLDREVSEALVRGARAAAAAGEPERSRELAERAVEVAPHRMETHEARIAALLGLGRLEEAAAGLRDAEEQTGAEADEEPLSGLRHRLEAMRHAAPGPGEERSTLFEFTDRRRELSILTRVWHRAAAGQREVALVKGPAGIGKTRLSQELAALVRASGGVVVRARALPSDRTIELGLVAELVSGLLALPGAAGTSPGSDRVLRSLVPSRRGAGDGAENAAGLPAHVALADAFADLLGAVAFESPLLVVCDDVQWADAASRALLVRVARRLRAEPIMLVNLYRADAATAADRAAEEQVIRELGAVPLPLRPLTVNEVGELLEASGLSRPSDDVARRIDPVVRGNPLFLRHLVEDLEVRGLLRSDGTIDPGQLADPPALPGPVAAELRRRLDALRPDAIALAGALARAGPPTPSSRLRRAAGLSTHAFDRAAAELGEAGVVHWEGDDSLGFVHPQVRLAALSVTREPPAERPLPSWPKVVLGAGALALLTVFAVGAYALGVFTSGAPAYGGGTVFMHTPDGWVTLDAEGRDPARWKMRALGDSVPASADRPLRGPDGSILWYARVRHEDRGPDIAILRASGDTLADIRSRGDLYLGSLSPDAQWVAYSREDTTADHYREDEVTRRITGGQARVVYPGRGLVSAPEWSPDGQLLAFVAQGPADTLRVLTPGGDTVASWTGQRISTVDWCGAGLAADITRGNAHQIAFYRPGEAEPRIFDGIGFAPLACSPDGSVLIHSGVRDGRRVLVLRDLTTGETRVVPAPAHAGQRILVASGPAHGDPGVAGSGRRAAEAGVGRATSPLRGGRLFGRQPSPGGVRAVEHGRRERRVRARRGSHHGERPGGHRARGALGLVALGQARDPRERGSAPGREGRGSVHTHRHEPLDPGGLAPTRDRQRGRTARASPSGR